MGFIQLVKTFIVHNYMTKEVDLFQHDQEVPKAFMAELSQQVEISSYDVVFGRKSNSTSLVNTTHLSNDS